MTLHIAQRAADAAFFEDWSGWTSLDDLPQRPTKNDQAIQYGARTHGSWSRYYCVLSLSRGWVDGPHFEVAVPPCAPIADLVRALPGARQHPGLYGRDQVSLRRLRNTWHIPAQYWADVRGALPGIKAATVQWAETSR